MTTISSSSAALNLAGSIVGGIPAHSSTDRNKAVSGDRKMIDDREADLSKTLGEISDAELDSERDADGRLPYHRQGDPSPSVTADVQNSRSSGHARDAFGDRGNSLDIDG
jgi:hypothetical protein